LFFFLNKFSKQLPNFFLGGQQEGAPQPQDGSLTTQPQSTGATSKPQVGSTPQTGSQAGAASQQELFFLNKFVKQLPNLGLGVQLTTVSQPQTGSPQPTSQPESQPPPWRPNKPNPASAELLNSTNTASNAGAITRRIGEFSMDRGIVSINGVVYSSNLRPTARRPTLDARSGPNKPVSPKAA